jgi:hypothetical protein
VSNASPDIAAGSQHQSEKKCRSHLPSGDQSLGQVRHEMEQKEPVCLCPLRVEIARDDTGRDIVHHDQPIGGVRMILREAGRYPRAAIVADERDLVDVETLHQLAEVIGHGALVIA